MTHIFNLSYKSSTAEITPWVCQTLFLLGSERAYISQVFIQLPKAAGVNFAQYNWMEIYIPFSYNHLAASRKCSGEL